MGRREYSFSALSGIVFAVTVFVGYGLVALYGSDHSDVPRSGSIIREDANIADFHAFVSGSNLVLAIATNVAIPKSATSYVFPADVTFDFNIDTDSPVDPRDPFGDGGTVLYPHDIQEEITYRVRFHEDGSARVQQILHGRGEGPAFPGLRDDRSRRLGRNGRDAEAGILCEGPAFTGFFAGLRDDPFIRGPRQGRNLGAIVLEVPLAAVMGEQSTLLLWATSKVEEFEGIYQDLAGRSLRSMFVENDVLNKMHPKHHLKLAGMRPDVMIYNVALPAAFPNGHALVDDVVDMVGDNRLLRTDAPFPSTNDMPFLSAFPYLAAPHPPTP